MSNYAETGDLIKLNNSYQKCFGFDELTQDSEDYVLLSLMLRCFASLNTLFISSKEIKKMCICLLSSGDMCTYIDE